MSPTAREASREQSALLISITASAFLGVGALVWGVLSETRVVMFDGVFLLAGLLLSGVSLVAARVSTSRPTRAYPYGKHAVTPLAVGLQGAALLGTVAYAAVDAITTLIEGGDPASAVNVAIYGAVSAAASAVVALLVGHRAPRSDLAGAEVDQWRAGVVLSVVLGLGGVAALVLEAAGVDGVVAYTDPVLVLVACAVILPAPLRLLRAAGRELVEAAPPASVLAAIDLAVEQVRAEFGLTEPLIRATKLGRRLYVDVEFVVEAGQWDVAQEDEVRRAVVRRLRPLGYELGAMVELTTDPTWAE